jgi:hypothetical protein
LFLFQNSSLFNHFQVCHLQGFSFYEPSRLNRLILVHPVAVTIPLLSLLYPICWIVANYYALAKLVGCWHGDQIRL